MLETKTLVKICGITSIEQAVQVAELGTNAVEKHNKGLTIEIFILPKAV